MAEKHYPEPTVGALIFNKESKIFLMKSNKWSNKWCVPGGHIEIGETIDEALIREIKEETNLDVFNISFLGIQNSIFDPDYHKKKHFIFIDFLCNTDSNKVILNHEAQEYSWFTLNEALNLPLNYSVRKAINEYIKRYLA